MKPKVLFKCLECGSLKILVDIDGELELYHLQCLRCFHKGHSWFDHAHKQYQPPDNLEFPYVQDVVDPTSSL